MIFLAILSVILLAVLDGSISALIISGGLYIAGVLFVFAYHRNNCKIPLRLYNIVFPIYLILAFIVSYSFSVTDYFFLYDPSRYIEFFINSTYVFWNKESLMRCYFEFADNNALHNALLNNVAVYANNSLDGITVYGLTLCHTIWGVLSSVVFYKILVRRFDKNKAFRLALFFAFCSLFLFYSTVIIRDIIICFLYLLAFDIIDQKFKLSGVIKLLLIIFITWGIRLYSGIFLVAFLGYYFFVKIYNTRYKKIVILFFVIFLVGIGSAIFTLDIIQQTISEMNEYAELSNDRSEGGVISKLQALPIGVSHLAIVLFTMIRPLPPFSIYMGVETFSHFVMSTMFLIAGFFWFVVFYSLCYLLFFKKYIFKIPFERIILLLVCLVFMLANASHPDIRRILPIFPILYVQYAEICKTENITLFSSKISKNLMIFYIVIAFGMLVIM